MIKQKADADLSKCKIVFFLGPPCSGKKTQAMKLVQDFGYIHLSLGHLLRAEIKKVITQLHKIIHRRAN